MTEQVAIKPAVAIIIPTYNHANFLREALFSITAQTFTNWEAIVVNNFSHDDTIGVVKEFSDPRIKIVNFANHGIIAASRNFGLSLTAAPLVAFLDSDDVWYPQKLDCVIKKLEQGYDLVCHAEVWMGPGRRRRTVRYGPESLATYESLLFNGNCISTSAVVVRRSWLERVGFFSIKSEFVTAEDYDLWLRLARERIRIGFVDEVFGEYRIHTSNQSRGALRNSEAVSAVFENHYDELEDIQCTRKVRRREALILYSGARALQEGGRHQEASGYFLSAIARYPWVLRFYVAILLNVVGVRF
jgi:glycosyltransferase involved in cell wall biosynthesis